ncbi:MAG: DUF6396 domain-containing protein [Pseudomonadota bacterium]
MPNAHVLPRNQSLPLFNPHLPSFTCEIEAAKVPPIDAQAEAWFLEARALESPEIYVDDRDYKKIVQLTRQAAERHHWKAMLNLASHYLKRRDPQFGVEDALRMVEEAMRLSIPAAYDRMGTYHMNGTGVKADATRAYAFWQKAAQMGSPHAMHFIGSKLTAGEDSPKDSMWDNIPVATKMMECALGQGYGAPAEDLSYLYAVPRSEDGTVIGERTRETRARAIKVLHDGLKLGCRNCARDLSVEFSNPDDLSYMLAPFIDKTRAKRYAVLRDALDFDPDRRFPNLDQVVPLPPADLPHWDGKRDTLLEAAMGVSLHRPPPPPPKPGVASHDTQTDRHYLDPAFALRHRGLTSAGPQAPAAAYWKPTAPGQAEHLRAMLAQVPPGLYRAGETFASWNDPRGDGLVALSDLVWERWDTVRHNHGEVDPQAAPGLARQLADPPAQSVSGQAPCPARGVWQPWIDPEHRLAGAVNQPWRQVWLNAGQAFPLPARDWPLVVPDGLRWHLLDGAGVKLG